MAGEAISSSARHGQWAETPVAIPPLGWRDVARRVAHEVGDDRVMLIAAGVTYYMLMALVPALAVFVSFYGLFNDPTKVAQQLALLQGILPEGGLDILHDQLSRLTTTGRPTLSITLVVSLVVSLWSAGAGIRSLMDAMNIAYDETEKRNFFVLNVLALAFTMAMVAAAVVFLAAVVLIPVILNLLYLSTGFEWLVRVASYGLMAVLLLIGLSALYRWGPSREKARWRWITPGAAIAVLGIGAVSVLFSWYAANFSNYNATYGSLGALVGLLTWIWLSVTILIVGAELNAELEHQVIPDSTTGASRPLGQRGAYMADHVATVGRMASADGKSGDAGWQKAADAEPARISDWSIALGLAAVLVLASAGGQKRTAGARRP